MVATYRLYLMNDQGLVDAEAFESAHDETADARALKILGKGPAELWSSSRIVRRYPAGYANRKRSDPAAAKARQEAATWRCRLSVHRISGPILKAFWNWRSDPANREAYDALSPPEAHDEGGWR